MTYFPDIGDNTSLVIGSHKLRLISRISNAYDVDETGVWLFSHIGTKVKTYEPFYVRSSKWGVH